MFQSAPLTEARGDLRLIALRARHEQFQSAPLTEARGDLRPNRKDGDNGEVSIRSPHRSKGRHFVPQEQSAVFKVSIRSLTEARGDRIPQFLLIALNCFNPLPSPKQGETGLSNSSSSLVAVSIRSPHRSKGRPGVVGNIAVRVVVSIRSPHRSKGRPTPVARNVSWSRFQSAPFTEARGDGDWRGTRSGCSPVSIRSPHRSKGRHLLFPCIRAEMVSIRSPHRSKGRRRVGCEHDDCAEVSIRSPHRSKGRPDRLGELYTEISVSIRSPHRSKGRPRWAFVWY